MRAHALLLLLIPVAACGGSDAQCVIDTDCPLFNRCMAQQCVPIGGGGDAAMDSSVPMDSSPGDSAPTDSAVDTGPTIVGSGTVTVSQTPLPMAMTSHSLSAGFARDTGMASPCTVTEAAPCTITECVTAPPMDAGVSDAGMGDASTPTIPHAGQINVSGGMVDLMITPGMDGTYPPATGTGLVYSGGETLNVTAAGDEVPAFAQSVTAPNTVTVSSPSVAAGTIAIDRAMDLAVTWTDGAAGEVIVRLTGFEMPMSGGTRSVSLACTFDGAGGTGTVPASALGNLPGGGASGSFSVETSASTEVMASGWLVTISASSIARGDTGGAASAATTYP
jgi:hypothetical protein